MSTTFDRAFAHTMRFEGGFVDDPDDPGGATKYGVSLRYLLSLGEIERFDYDGDGDVDAHDIKALTPAEAAEIYQEEFWLPVFDEIPNEKLAIKCFDFGVNTGPRQRTKLLQRALNELMVASDALIVDGSFGPMTTETLLDMREREHNIILGDLEDHAARFYYALAEKRRKARKYLFGWLRRCFDRPEI